MSRRNDYNYKLHSQTEKSKRKTIFVASRKGNLRTRIRSENFHFFAFTQLFMFYEQNQWKLILIDISFRNLESG